MWQRCYSSILLFIILNTFAYSNIEKLSLEANSVGFVEEVNLKLSYDKEEDKRVLNTIVEKNGTDFFKILVSDIELKENRSLILKIYNQDLELTSTYNSEFLSSKKFFWTDIIFGQKALVRIESEDELSEFSIKIKKIAFQSHIPSPLSVTGKDERENAEKFYDNLIIKKASRSVANISFISGDKLKNCTGFLIGDNKLITNEHCINDVDTCNSASITFGYEYAEEILNFGETFQCKEITKISYELDYSVIELYGKPGEKWGYIHLASRDPQTTPVEQLILIQHPLGKPKQISKIGCIPVELPSIGRLAESDFSHECDTEGGASGSPILSLDGQVLGLHHFGFGEAAYWDKNRGIRSTLIKTHLEDD